MSGRRGLLGLGAVLFTFALAAAAFTVPPRLEDHEWDTDAYRYADLDDGAASLTRVSEDGGAVTWESNSVSLLPGLKALGELPPELEGAVAEHITGDPDADQAIGDLDAIRDVRVFGLSRRAIDADGALTAQSEIVVADAAGITSLGSAPVGGSGEAIVFSPGVLLLPADPEPGNRWESEGTVGTSTYTWQAEIRDTDDYDGPLGRFDDCITTESALTFTAEGQDPQQTDYTDTWCAGAGNVATEAEGVVDRSFERVATLDASTGAEGPGTDGPGPGDDDAVSGPDGDPATWSIRRAGSVLPATSSATSTFSPVYVPGEQPVVVAAAEATGDVVALGVGDQLGLVQWRIATGGATYSRPRWDPERRRLYFGATDGYVRAVDARGFFLWAAPADDAVSGTPVVADDVLVFGSEDGTIQGVDADTGEPAWELAAGAPVAAGGALVDGTVVMVDTAGVVRGIDPDDGDVAWTHEITVSVEAPVGTSPDGVLVADRGGGVTLIDAEGDVAWATDVGRGYAIRSEPVVVGGNVLTVDDLGTVTAVALEDGEVTWRHDGDFSGAVAAVGDTAVVATAAGEVLAFGAGGDELQRMSAVDAMTDDVTPPSFTYGPTPGGGQLWLADDAGTVRSIGDGATGPGQLTAVWSTTAVEAPYEAAVITSPVPFGDRLLVTDANQRLLSIDPTEGTTELVGEFGEEGDTSLAAPVIAGDVLLVDLGGRLVAVSAEDASVQWEVPLLGTRSLPPAVSGGVVVTSSETPDGPELLGIDLTDGTVLWRRPSGTVSSVGATAAGPDAGVVFAGAPVEAIDTATGEALWTSEIDDPAGGLATDGDVVAIPTYTDGDASGGIAVVDAATGEVEWQRIIEGEGAGVTTRLLITDDLIVLPSLTGNLIAVDLADGTERWDRPAAGPLLGTAALLERGVAYALENGQFFVADPATGDTLASFEGLGTDIGATSIGQQPVELGGTITVVAGSVLFAVSEAS